MNRPLLFSTLLFAMVLVAVLLVSHRAGAGSIDKPSSKSPRWLTTDCNSEPRNPLCLPEMKLPKETEDVLQRMEKTGNELVEAMLTVLPEMLAQMKPSSPPPMDLDMAAGCVFSERLLHSAIDFDGRMEILTSQYEQTLRDLYDLSKPLDETTRVANGRLAEVERMKAAWMALKADYEAERSQCPRALRLQ
jgi:hypothetical protein